MDLRTPPCSCLHVGSLKRSGKGGRDGGKEGIKALVALSIILAQEHAAEMS